MAITPSVVASRTTGVAPLYVFFDCTGTTSDQTSAPWRDIAYRWDFGDTEASWSYGLGRSKNRAFGVCAAHVFETAGTFTVKVQMKDGDATTTEEVEITVDDPDTVFSGTNTICFSTTGTFTGKPTGASEVTTSDFDVAINNNIASGKRLLFRRGETFTSSTEAQIDVAGPGIIGAFGSGAKPLIEMHNGRLFGFGVSGAIRTDWRIMDLELDGNSGASTICFGADHEFDRMLMFRCTCHHTSFVAEFSDFALSGGESLWDEMAFVECDWTNIVGTSGKYGIYFAAERYAVMGCSGNNNGGGEHVIRQAHGVKGVVSNNTLQNPAGSKHCLTLRPPPWGTGVGCIPANTFAQYIVVTQNRFANGNGWVVHIGPQNIDAGTDERIRRCIFEGNWWSGEGGTEQLFIRAADITALNNLFDVSNADGYTGIHVADPGDSPDPNNFVAYNNTFYGSAAGTDWLAIELSLGTGHIVKNNLGYAPNHTSPVVLSGTATASNNSSNAQADNTSPSFVSGTPVNPDDFAIQTGSYAKNAGGSVPVFSDFFGNLRDQGTIDIGMHEFGASEWLIASGSHPPKLTLAWD